MPCCNSPHMCQFSPPPVDCLFSRPQGHEGNKLIRWPESDDVPPTVIVATVPASLYFCEEDELPLEGGAKIPPPTDTTMSDG